MIRIAQLNNSAAHEPQHPVRRRNVGGRLGAEESNSSLSWSLTNAGRAAIGTVAEDPIVAKGINFTARDQSTIANVAVDVAVADADDTTSACIHPIRGVVGYRTVADIGDSSAAIRQDSVAGIGGETTVLGREPRVDLRVKTIAVATKRTVQESPFSLATRRVHGNAIAGVLSDDGVSNVDFCATGYVDVNASRKVVDHAVFDVHVLWPGVNYGDA